MNRPLAWIAGAFVALLLLGRSPLPLNAQWGDLLFPLLLVAVLRAFPRREWCSGKDWPLALYLALTLGASVFSPDPLRAAQQFLKSGYAASIFLVFRVMTGDRELSRSLVRTLVAATTLVTLASIVTVFLGLPGVPLRALGASDALPFFGRAHRLRGAFLTPEMLGDFFVVAFVLALALRSDAQGRARSVWTAAAASLGLGEILTVSHSVAGFALAAVLFLAADLPSRALRRVAWSAVFLVFVLVNAASVADLGNQPNDYGVAPLSVEVAGTRIEGQLSHYAALKQIAWQTGLEHPWTGVGPGRFPEETERAFREGRLPARYRDKPPQCDLLGRLAETGVPGLVSLLLLWASWLKGILPRLRTAPALQRAAGAAVVGLLVNSLNADVMNFRFLWVALAWALPNQAASGGPADRDPSVIPFRD